MTIFKFTRAEMANLDEAAATKAVEAFAASGEDEITIDSKARTAAETALIRMARELQFNTQRPMDECLRRSMETAPNIAKLATARHERRALIEGA
jgi:hypothetical protein